MVLPNLPQEIIAEILTRLPVKSLLRFRCVSKSWLSLIDAPQFIKSHLNKSCNSQRLASVFNLPFAIYSSLLDSPIQLSPANATLLDSPFNGIPRVDLLGSCNGLICMKGDSRRVVLWNPSTKKCRELPQFPLPACCYVIHEFGYDELNDDYKLVQIFSTDLRATGFVDVSVGGVNIYSLRTNSWRNIKVNGLSFPTSAGKFANGALHWLVKHFDGLWSISSFDLANETFQNIHLPNTNSKGRAVATIGSLGGRLCLCGDYHHQNRLDLWILENGENESWTKLVSIPYSEINPKVPISPLYVSENGEILLLFGSRLVLYNKKDKTFYYPDIRVDPLEHKMDACIYVESLVSPNLTPVEKLELGPIDH